jgi:hypothetical protein
MPTSAGDGDSTLIMEGAGKGHLSKPRVETEGTWPSPLPGSGGGTGDKTIVVGPSRPRGEGPPASPTAQRKLTAWLISFTLSPFGVDFRLFEGQNNIGRDAKNSVRITEDSSVSSEHATILCRGEKFFLQDKLSTNPSYVNGEELLPGATIELKDGDELTIGKTVFRIRFAQVPSSKS